MIFSSIFLALLYGGIAIGFAFVCGKVSNIIDLIVSTEGAAIGPLVATFTFAAFVPFATEKVRHIKVKC